MARPNMSSTICHVLLVEVLGALFLQGTPSQMAESGYAHVYQKEGLKIKA